MNTKLFEISEIKSGYLFKTGLQSKLDGSVSVIQLKDVDNNGLLSEEGIQRINSDIANNDHFVKKGDILFKAKTNHPVSAVVTNDITNTIVTAHYFIIRLQSTEVIAEYLSWYLNQHHAQLYFSKHAGGTRIQVITKQVLGNIEVKVPSLLVQEKIIKVSNLLAREKQIIDLLKEKKYRIYTRKLNELTKK